MKFEQKPMYHKQPTPGVEQTVELARDYGTEYLNKEEYISPEKNMEIFLDYYESHKVLFHDGGMNAIIYELPVDHKKLVIKEMRRNKTSGFAQNSSEMELDTQDNLYHLGVCVPVPVGLIKITEKDFVNKKLEKKELIIMEKIDGFSIGDYKRDVLVSNSMTLPESFSLEKFMEDLKQEIKKMHDDGIYHKDLTPNNVMIDSLGNPVIIDFGTAGYGFGEDPYEAPNHVVIMNGQRQLQSSRYVSDEQNLLTIEGALKDIIKQKGIDKTS